MTVLSAEILPLDQPKGVEVEQVFAGMGLGADEQPGQMLFLARSTSGCHAALFMDK
jgi:hypothetical protein